MSQPSQEFKDGMAVLRACGNVSRLVYLELMAHMEEKWPDRGWIIETHKLERYYSDRGLKLSTKTEGVKFDLDSK